MHGKFNCITVNFDKTYCKYYSQGIVVFLVSNGHVDSEISYHNRQNMVFTFCRISLYKLA